MNNEQILARVGDDTPSVQESFAQAAKNLTNTIDLMFPKMGQKTKTIVAEVLQGTALVSSAILPMIIGRKWNVSCIGGKVENITEYLLNATEDVSSFPLCKT